MCDKHKLKNLFGIPPPDDTPIMIVKYTRRNCPKCGRAIYFNPEDNKGTIAIMFEPGPGSLVYADIKPFMVNYIRQDGKICLGFNRHKIQFYKLFIELLIKCFRLTGHKKINSYIARSIRCKLSLEIVNHAKYLLSQDILTGSYLSRCLAVITDNDFVIDYLQDKEIPMSFIKTYACLPSNTIMTKYLSDRGVLTSEICRGVLLNWSYSYSIEACKILIHHLTIEDAKIVASHPIIPYNIEFIEYLSQYHNLSYKARPTPDLDLSYMGKYLCINCPNYMIEYNISKALIENLILLPIDSLMEYLVFSKQFELAYQLGEELPPNNYFDMMYYYIKRIYAEYDYYCRTQIIRTKPSSSCKQLSDPKPQI